MGTVIWRNLTLVPEEEIPEYLRAFDSEGRALVPVIRDGDSIFVYTCCGPVIEVHPATGVRLTEDSLEILDERVVVAVYPREKIVLASHHPIELPPFS